ncbi:hypothetical protein LEP1GSC038_0783 [Leptospira weilii str. 2006001855]|uniref:Uncharacterized protein n=1 Tax=Leptospira weilii str. 2006001855 TaxID=996804 RepID=M6FXH1_9LEPT|nr:hypothetical protein LEP1GSC038_0783 [Leptospira weilii str. 2006001855]
MRTTSNQLPKFFHKIVASKNIILLRGRPDAKRNHSSWTNPTNCSYEAIQKK